MITRIEISNFRVLESINAVLKPLTVLIGANNTGKSSFLAAIQTLGAGVEFRPKDVFVSAKQDAKARSIACQSKVKGVVNGQDFSNEVVLEFGRPPKQSRTNPINGVGLFQLPACGVTCHCLGFDNSKTSPVMASDGSNLAAILDDMLRNSRKRFLDLVNCLRELIPGFEDLNIQTPTKEGRQITAVLDNGIELSGDVLSSGVRHLIFFATLAYQPNPPSIILIEEPESGVHPKRLGDIVSLLRGISLGRHGGTPSQVIISTHSPFLLDAIDLNTDQVLVFRRENTPAGRRTVEPVDRDRLKNFLDDFMLGEIWYNQEEDGLVSKKT